MGKIFILYGPSASGKTEIQQQLTSPLFPRIITATTRPPRHGEEDGIHYRFLSTEEFQHKMEQNELVEWTLYNSHYYGTLRSSVEEVLAGKMDANSIMDLPGVLALKKQYGPYIRAIYIGADLASLRKRLLERGSDPAEAAARVAKAQGEELSDAYMAHADIAIWNNDSTDFAQTLQQVRDYIAANGSQK
ncbi:guanylate kinase [Paenibacillus donghaensis]|uniref:Guanylate kinase-like domain-containing protein n=1 Tax=Paenibacillus donghaensis TaxID=414771 RepID=A0A2Z2KVR7_9BACL|nr:guanylate kinase [Paenibacillus donghaensis]ASA24028.1 hypothetical protein B9T62_26540 [Paenibacillus donghaensis]